MVLRKPSFRRKRTPDQEIRLNLVPMMDVLVTLITFILFTLTFFAFVSLPTLLPEISATPPTSTLPLQLTATIQTDKIILWSPFQHIKDITIANLPDGTPDMETFHQTLVSLKSKFPEEKSLVFFPHATLAYDTLISLLDQVRTLKKTDPSIFTHTDPPLAIKELFPNLTFGNLIE